jgi:hypothetical protein
MRQELGISEEEHLQAITELGIENPELLDPNQQRTKENQLRIQGFQQRIKGLANNKRRRGATGLGRELLKVVKKEKSVHDVLQKDEHLLRSLSHEYDITPEEEALILAELAPEIQLIRRSNTLLDQLQQLADCHQALENKKLSFEDQPHLIAGLNLLQKTIQRKQKLFTKGILDILEQMDASPEATRIALALASLASISLSELLRAEADHWKKRLNPSLLGRLHQQIQYTQTIRYPFSEISIVPYLEILVEEPDSLTKAASLYLIAHLEILRAQQKAYQLLESYLMLNPLVKETAQSVLNNDIAAPSTLKKLLYLSSSELLENLKSEQLLDLAYQAQIKTYQALDVILLYGHCNQELLMLVEGEVKQEKQNGQFYGEIITPVQMLNQVELLAQIPQMNTLIAMKPETKVLSIDHQFFEEAFAQDKDLIRKVLGQLATSRELIGEAGHLSS